MFRKKSFYSREQGTIGTDHPKFLSIKVAILHFLVPHLWETWKKRFKLMRLLQGSISWGTRAPNSRPFSVSLFHQWGSFIIEKLTFRHHLTYPLDSAYRVLFSLFGSRIALFCLDSQYTFERALNWESSRPHSNPSIDKNELRDLGQIPQPLKLVPHPWNKITLPFPLNLTGVCLLKMITLFSPSLALTCMTASQPLNSPTFTFTHSVM